MSIAVSAVVNPSRLLLAAIGGMCLGIVFGAALIGFGRIGEMPNYARVLTAGSCALVTFFAFYWAIKTRKTFRIDISDIGQIRLEEYIGTGDTSSLANVAGGKVLELLPDSTIWTHILLLRLRTEDNQIIILPILRDCVEKDAYRLLSIACRWIAAQNNRLEPKKSDL